MKDTKPMVQRHYESHPDALPWDSFNDVAKRQLENAWFGCNQNEQEFHEFLETVRDIATSMAGGDIECAVATTLKPAKREKWQPPQIPTMDGVPMPNPYLKNGSVADRKFLERKLALAESEHRDNRNDLLAAAEFRRWSELVTHLKRSASEPLLYALERDHEEQRRQKFNGALEAYDHSKNAYATLSGILEFEQSIEPELKPLYRALARPIVLPLFGAHSDQHRTLLARLYHVGGKKVWAAIEKGQQREMERRKDEAEQAAKERNERVKQAIQANKELGELMAGIVHLPDGRVITTGYGRRITA